MTTTIAAIRASRDSYAGVGAVGGIVGVGKAGAVDAEFRASRALPGLICAKIPPSVSVVPP